MKKILLLAVILLLSACNETATTLAAPGEEPSSSSAILDPGVILPPDPVASSSSAQVILPSSSSGLPLMSSAVVTEDRDSLMKARTASMKSNDSLKVLTYHRYSATNNQITFVLKVYNFCGFRVRIAQVSNVKVYDGSYNDITSSIKFDPTTIPTAAWFGEGQTQQTYPITIGANVIIDHISMTVVLVDDYGNSTTVYPESVITYN